MKLRLSVKLRAARTSSIAVLAMAAGALDASGQNPSAQANPAAPTGQVSNKPLGEKGRRTPAALSGSAFLEAISQ